MWFPFQVYAHLLVFNTVVIKWKGSFVIHTLWLSSDDHDTIQNLSFRIVFVQCFKLLAFVVNHYIYAGTVFWSKVASKVACGIIKQIFLPSWRLRQLGAKIFYCKNASLMAVAEHIWIKHFFNFYCFTVDLQNKKNLIRKLDAAVNESYERNILNFVINWFI